jgi:hypothetical protein
MEREVTCAAPGCDLLVSGNHLHCDIHFDKFSKAHDLYKREQKKIEKYVDNPSLLDKLTPQQLIRVAGVSLTVSEMRRSHITLGFKEEIQDQGHHKMIDRLLMLSLHASKRLTQLFDLPPINNDSNCQADSSSTMTVDDDGNATDPLEVAILLHKERTELINMEKKRRQEQDVLLDGLVTQKAQWMRKANEALISLIRSCNVILVNKCDPPPAVIHSDGSVRDTLHPGDCAAVAAMLFGEQSPFRTLCASTGTIDRVLDRCPTDEDFEKFYQHGLDVSELLLSSDQRGRDIIVEFLSIQCPPQCYLMIYITPETCLKFLVCIEDGGQRRIQGEIVIRLTHMKLLDVKKRGDTQIFGSTLNVRDIRGGGDLMMMAWYLKYMRT